MSTHHHRSTLKQKNKPFKSKHATKGSLKEQAKGRVPQYHAASGVAGAGVVKRADPRIPPIMSQAQSKLNRRNQAKQIQKAKRQSLVEATRLFNGVDGTPRVVAVVPLCKDISARDLVLKLLKGLGEDAESITADCPERGIWRARAERFRTSLQFLLLPYGQLYATLDAVKGADYIILGLSASTEVDSWGDMLLRSLQAQGFPQAIAVVPTTHDDTSMEEKSRKSTMKTAQSVIKSLLSFVQYFVPTLTRVFDLSSTSEASTALRSLCEGKPNDVRWRMGRGYLVSEALSYDLDTISTSEESTGSKGVLKVTGVARGAPISANRLIHIPGWGDFQLKRIIATPRNPRGPQGDGTMDVEAKVLSEPSTGGAGDDVDQQDDLVSVNEVDDMQNEQTWPTEEDMREGASAIDGADGLPDADEGTTPKVVKRVPKGTSAYQAAWLLEDEEVDEDASELDEEEGTEQGGGGSVDMNDGASEMASKVDDEEEYEDVVEEKSSRAVAFEDMDMEEEKRQLESWRARQKEHSTHLAFPDEIDTPMDIPARQRFARYRGLKSFRTSPWDPNENLPRDYAKIFRVGEKEWDSVSRKIMHGDAGDGVEPGTRVTLEIQGVPQAFMDAYDPTLPLVVHALYRHEHKKTVLNFTLQRNSEYNEPVRSKDSLILCVGPRRLAVNPLFSQHLRGGAKSTNNVHKFERFLREGVTSVGTIYGPLTFGRLPVTLLKETDDPQSPILVASGTLLPPSTSRIIAKRILLTGHPIKIHKRSVTVRYMFFNPADVAYFKPVQLSTKYGRTGHIIESLGTHGYFKAHFDGNVTQMDTVCLALYKRVYPKWAKEWSASANKDGGDEMEE